MTRAPLAGLALLPLLAGCPLPQPLADYPKGTVTPPRILMDAMTFRDTVVRVPAACTGTAPSYDLDAILVDNNTSETVTVRFFVDYDRTNSSRCAPAIPQVILPGAADSAPDPTRRTVPAYHFLPYDQPPVLGAGGTGDAPGVVHVVEMVVSNRFDTSSDDVGLCTPGTPATTFPYRTPGSEGGALFETQTYRWVFMNEAASADLPCP